jgi:hypothetical protein
MGRNMHTERDTMPPTNDPLPWRVLLPVGFALLGPMAAWALHLNLTYFLVQPVCAMGGEIALHISGFVCLLIALGALSTAGWLVATNPVPFRENVEGADGWKAFVGLFGMAASLIFGLAIITQWSAVTVTNTMCG